MQKGQQVAVTTISNASNYNGKFNTASPAAGIETDNHARMRLTTMERISRNHYDPFSATKAFPAVSVSRCEMSLLFFFHDARRTINIIISSVAPIHRDESTAARDLSQVHSRGKYLYKLCFLKCRLPVL